MKKLTFLFLLFLSVLCFLKNPSYASDNVIRSELITDSHTFYGEGKYRYRDYRKGSIWYLETHTSYVSYKSGRVVVSSTPDGTGNVRVEDILMFSTVYPNKSKAPYEVLITQECGKENSIPPIDITHLMTKIHDFNMVIAIYSKCKRVEPKYIGPLYLVFLEEPGELPPRFLDLPWDYKAKGLGFQAAALSMSSYFDHEYPLLSASYFLTEPAETSSQTLKFDGEKSRTISYSSHDGYDYARGAKANFGDPVLASASGWATYHNECSACGNAVYIDHENGYQTRYYHLQNDDLISTISNHRVWVESRDRIGLLGNTGNSTGPHIHFMVIHDKNGDGNFNDNIPDGIVDPFGWQSDEPDPWENFTFEQNGEQKTGSRSRSLWKYYYTDPMEFTLYTDGGKYLTGTYNFEFPNYTTRKDLILKTQGKSGIYTSGNLRSIGFSLEAIAIDVFQNVVTSFLKKFDLTVSLSQFDLSRYKAGSVGIYSSSDDGKTWQKEETELNLEKKTAKTSIDHLTLFTLMGEPLDTQAPETSVELQGATRTDLEMVYPSTNVYYSPVEATITSVDEPVTDSLGVQYTLLKVVKDGTVTQDWTSQQESATFEYEGEYELSYFSEDYDGNIEDVRQTSFVIYNNPAPTSTPTSTPTPTPNETSSKQITLETSTSQDTVSQSDFSINEGSDSKNEVVNKSNIQKIVQKPIEKVKNIASELLLPSQRETIEREAVLGVSCYPLSSVWYIFILLVLFDTTIILLHNRLPQSVQKVLIVAFGLVCCGFLYIQLCKSVIPIMMLVGIQILLYIIVFENGKESK